MGHPVPAGEPLMQAGLDSLAAVDLRRELASLFLLGPDALSPTLVFDYPSVEAIAEHVLPLLPLPPPKMVAVDMSAASTVAEWAAPTTGNSVGPRGGSSTIRGGTGGSSNGISGPAWLRTEGVVRQQLVLQQVCFSDHQQGSYSIVKRNN